MVPSPSELLSILLDPTPRPGLQPILNSSPLTVQAALLPPLIYYIALILLPPPAPPAKQSFVVIVVRSILATIAATFFFRLPVAYHVPQSIGLTYQLGLVGIYGGCRVLDCFFICPYLFGHIPRRVTYNHTERIVSPAKSRTTAFQPKEWCDGGLKDPFMSTRVTEGTKDLHGEPTPVESPLSAKPTPGGDKISGKSALRSDLIDSYFPEILHRAVTGPDPIPVYESARTEPTYPSTLLDRMGWALELELSMRGMGFTWTTADVRHTRKTWLPTVTNRVHSILVHVIPVSLGSWIVIRTIYIRYLSDEALLQQNFPIGQDNAFDQCLSLPLQLLLTACLGAFLMSAFSLGHSIFAIMLSPCRSFWPQLAFFPPLYTIRIYNVRSVRQFWSFGWHRLFARLFLVWGVWPGEFIERKLTGKTLEQAADIGKVIGAFTASAFVHSFSVRGVLAGDWLRASGEAKFFALNGVAVVIEGAVVRFTKGYRKSNKILPSQWYDKWIGRVWWIAVLLFTGRNFARGWTNAGLVREMAFM